MVSSTTIYVQTKPSTEIILPNIEGLEFPPENIYHTIMSKKVINPQILPLLNKDELFIHLQGWQSLLSL